LFKEQQVGRRVGPGVAPSLFYTNPCGLGNLIVAWRTLFVCRLGRECPDLDCQAVFEPAECKAVWVAVHQKKPPRTVPRLAAMVHLIARLGG
jgi:hypothetical protein